MIINKLSLNLILKSINVMKYNRTFLYNDLTRLFFPIFVRYFWTFDGNYNYNTVIYKGFNE